MIIGCSMSSSFIANSTACHHLATMPATANEEATNKL